MALIGFWPSPVDNPVAGTLDTVLGFLHGHGFPGWFNYPFVEAFANVLLFVPLGALLHMAIPRLLWWQLLGLGMAVSGTLELGQMLFLADRFPSWLDVLMNTLGTAAGLLIAALLRVSAQRRLSRGIPSSTT
ncbi:VanZ family protein [Arthrobacter sp. CJ23]|uniref:VanZ family protein n=1 Tax=Arthrobacter sp. CJ23 TaxID=2972479 RepID=UPI00215B9FC7|nr:VanZ family protein [Arthrobacter sp. CJ23]UVJ38745.1 VanZ family protein [Arthrobacter sp. CJ23]